MKKSFIIICFIFISYLLGKTQTYQWVSQTSGTTNSLYSVYFTSTNTGYVAGTNGTILKTNDGGTTWTALTSGTTNRLNCIYFTDANTGYAVGAGGTILKTINAGVTWTALTSGTTKELRSICFTSTNAGFVVGMYVILMTTNGGTTWSAKNFDANDDDFFSVYFTNANTGYAVGISLITPGNSEIFKTTNAGTDWQKQTFATTNVLASAFFTDANKGCVVGYNIIYNTTDGGITWTYQTAGVRLLTSVYFTDANTGYSVGLNGIIIKTTDGGLTWSTQACPTMYSLFSVFFSNANTGWAVGDLGNILKYTSTKPTITLGTNPSVCLGSAIANLNYSSTTNNPDHYSIVYDAAAHSAGFVDVTNATLPSSPISLTIPGSAIAGNYTGNLTVSNSATGLVSDPYQINIIVNANPTISLGANPVVNAGSTNANLPYNSTTGNPDHYSLVYSAAAHSAGFVDVNNAVLSSSPIILVVPANAAPATYTATLIVNNGSTGCTSTTYPISVTINFVSINISSMMNSRIFSKPDAVNSLCNDYPIIFAEAWTWSGVFGIMRTLIKFDLSGIPQNAIINSATLNLMGAGHNPLTHSNASTLNKVTQSWDYTNATWTNMNNKYTTTGNIAVPGTASGAPNENKTVDIKSMVQYWVSSPLSNYGMMLKLNDETKYTDMQFGSDDNTDLTKRPVLNISYSYSSSLKCASLLNNYEIIEDVPANIITPFSISSDSLLFDNNITISPIPANDFINVIISANGIEQVNYEVYNSEGIKLIAGKLSTNNNERVDIESLKQGVYYISFRYNNNVVTKKFVVAR